MNILLLFRLIYFKISILFYLKNAGISLILLLSMTKYNSLVEDYRKYRITKMWVKKCLDKDYLKQCQLNEMKEEHFIQLYFLKILCSLLCIRIYIRMTDLSNILMQSSSKNTSMLLYICIHFTSTECWKKVSFKHIF